MVISSCRSRRRFDSTPTCTNSGRAPTIETNFTASFLEERLLLDRRGLHDLWFVKLGANGLEILPHQPFGRVELAAGHPQDICRMEGRDRRDVVGPVEPLTALFGDR